MAHVSADEIHFIKNKIRKIEQRVEGAPILSSPPEGGRRVTNIYVDPVSNKTVIKWDDEVGLVEEIISNPPAGCKKVTNIYVLNGKTVLEYEV